MSASDRTHATDLITLRAELAELKHALVEDANRLDQALNGRWPMVQRLAARIDAMEAKRG